MVTAAADAADLETRRATVASAAFNARRGKMGSIWKSSAARKNKKKKKTNGKTKQARVL